MWKQVIRDNFEINFRSLNVNFNKKKIKELHLQDYWYTDIKTLITKATQAILNSR
jgi:hypothetical protein